MVLDHLAAIFLFSGPLFYVGLFMAWIRRVFRSSLNRAGAF